MRVKGLLVPIIVMVLLIALLVSTNAPTAAQANTAPETRIAALDLNGSGPDPAFASDTSHAESRDTVVYVSPTQLALAATSATPIVGQLVTFTATLTNGTSAPLASKSVTIYHYANGVLYNDTTAATNEAGQVNVTTSFSYAGQRTCYATFAGDDVDGASVSNAVVVNVGVSLTQLALAATNSTPIVGQLVTFTATLTNGTTAPLSSKPVTIYHYNNGVRYNDVSNVNTSAAGQVNVSGSFGSPGQRTYYAAFAGDSAYAGSTSSAVVVNVSVSQTQLALAATNSTPAVGHSVTLTATLANDAAAPISSKPVTIYHYTNGVRYNDVTNKATDANGQITATVSFGYAGPRTYYATFAGDAANAASTSNALKVNVGGASQFTQLSLSASSANPAVDQSVTLTATLMSGTTPLSSKPVTIYHYSNGVRYNDVTNKATDANGQITATVSFGYAGPRTYYATFAGDAANAASTSNAVVVNVQ
jgi:hypothetical protein